MSQIQLITGPMFAGKSEHLIRDLHSAQAEGLTIAAFKHASDTRYSANDIVSHSGKRISAQAISSSVYLRSLTLNKADVVGIDEAHFFDNDLPSVVQGLCHRGIRVIIAGLDLDYLGNPFDVVQRLLSIADQVTHKQAVCARCGAYARFSQRIVASNARILIGAEGMYEPRCHECFVPCAGLVSDADQSLVTSAAT